MWGVVIADDEPIIRSGIAKIIPWNKYDCQVAGIARNGEEALELIKKTGAKIVISDIKMPKMNGLKLLDELRKAELDVYFIIVSGYDEFQYVQKALNNGAFGYLLKPIIPEELEEMIRRAAEKAGEVWNEEEAEGAGNEKLFESEPLHSRLEWLPAWLSGDISRERKEKLQRELTEENARWHIMALIHPLRAEASGEALVEERLFLAETVFEEAFENMEYIQFVKDRQLVYAVLSVPERGSIDWCAKQLKYAWNKYGKSGNTALAVSKAGESLRALLDMQAQVQKIARYQLFGGDYFFTERQYREEYDNWEKCAGFTCRELENMVLAGEKELLLKKLRETTEGKLLEECRYILRAALFRGHESSVPPSQRSLDYRPGWLAIKKEMTERAGKSNELRQVVEEAFCEIFERLDLLCSKNMQMMVERAKAIARLEYADADLSLSLVAQRLGFNAAYFSHAFSAVQQQGFAEFLTNIRIQRAKELLLTDMKIQNIAQSVGYSSQPYFSTRFRAETGLTPSQYREKYAIETE